jgi:demethylmenaquinone methyltransferase/2-methoxy-6-polyprenyl-1,4-benzoquinol methylase
MRVLDACTGNGQVIRAASEMVGETGWIVGLDASLGMLAVGSQAIKSPFAQGYVESLPFSSRSFDFVTMGYALRHVSSLGETFCEYHRVLKPGGRLLVLEFTRPSSSVMYYLSKMYLRYLVPAIARMKGRNSRTLMEYFWDTVENCVPPEIILEQMAEAGFKSPIRQGQNELFSEYTCARE